MNRRDFLHYAQGLGLLTLSPRLASAQSGKYTGPVFLSINASGGWDPTCLFDPKVGMPNGKVINKAFTTIATTQGIAHAPVTFSAGGKVLDSPKAFLEAHAKDFLFINGLDTATNNHDVGVQAMGCGKGSEPLPTFGALVAAQAAQKSSVPLAFISSSGYENTGNLISLTRTSTDQVRDIAYLERRYSGDPAALFLPDNVNAKLETYRTARLGRVLSQAQMPKEKQSVLGLQSALTSKADIRILAELLPKDPVTLAKAFPSLTGYNDGELEYCIRNVELAMLGFAAGVTVSANVGIGGFDTHANHDELQFGQLGKLLLAIRYSMAKRAELNLQNRLYIVVTSDFGRTPEYNDGNGKDHWNVTSAMVSGPNIGGGRVVGASDEGHRPKSFKAGNVAAEADPKDPNSVRIRPEHLHAELRKRAGLSGTPLDTQFPLPVEKALPLF
jgi:Protein of unknown function (DUF1501)